MAAEAPVEEGGPRRTGGMRAPESAEHRGDDKSVPRVSTEFPWRSCDRAAQPFQVSNVQLVVQ